eukprot:Skav229021  [mRNA]  locus=scaffold127:543885:546603:- [translate_table: standard]
MYPGSRRERPRLDLNEVRLAQSASAPQLHGAPNADATAARNEAENAILQAMLDPRSASSGLTLPVQMAVDPKWSTDLKKMNESLGLRNVAALLTKLRALCELVVSE